MAFQNPQASDDDGDEPSLFAEVNITPLTDVILVLLIIFMVSSSAMVDAARQEQLSVNLPAARGGGFDAAAPEIAILNIYADGRLGLDGETVSMNELQAILEDRHKKKPNESLVIDADGDLAHRRVVEVMDAARQAGYQNVGIGVSANP